MTAQGSRTVSFAEPRHYWIEDEDPNLNRVEVLPDEAIAPYLDARVRVTGRFRYASQQGRKLTLESVEKASAAPAE